MRRAFLILCVVCSPGVAVAQVGQVSGTAANSYSRPTFFVGPSYRATGDTFRVAQGPTTVYSLPRSSSLGGSFQSNPTGLANVVTSKGQAQTALSRYYPSLRFSPPTDIRPQEYVIPPVTRTPLHDPFFEERVFSPYDDDPYEYWGW